MTGDLELQVTAFLILFARVGAVLMMLPVFSDQSVPAQVRLLLSLAMTVALWGLLGPQTMPAARSGALPAVLLAELMTGMAMGAIIKIFFSAVSIAGSMISLQMGLSSAVLFDPSQGSQVPLMSKFVTIAAAVVCMSLQVHHLWIEAIVRSYALFPVGGLPPAADFAQIAVETVNRSMSLGIALAAPLLIYGIVFNVALGLAARLSPAIQVFFIAQPLNVLAGLTLASVVVGLVLTRFAGAMAAWLNSGWA